MEKYCPIAHDTDERLTTILSIDGGGIRCVIPGTILAVLEEELQKLDGEDARIADYFDCIAGVNTGGIITGMLTAPSEGDRPCAATEIIKFFREEARKIFSKEVENTYLIGHPRKQRYAPVQEDPFYKKMLRRPLAMLRSAGLWTSSMVLKSKYDNTELAQRIEEKVGEIRVADTLTNVVIPSYDLDDMHPVIFSTQQEQEKESNLQLAHAIMSTTAFPYYFPPFKYPAADGKEHSLVDGAIAASNPTLFAIREAARMVEKYKCPDYSKFVVISLGTGSAKVAHNIDKGGMLEWVIDWLDPKKSTPFFADVLFRAADDIIEISTALALGLYNSTHTTNFLRIQDYKLDPDRYKLTDTSEENINALDSIAKYLLDMPISVANPTTGLQEVLPDSEDMTTNREAIAYFAKILSEERRRRISQAQKISQQ